MRSLTVLAALGTALATAMAVISPGAVSAQTMQTEKVVDSVSTPPAGVLRVLNSAGATRMDGPAATQFFRSLDTFLNSADGTATRTMSPPDPDIAEASSYTWTTRAGVTEVPDPRHRRTFIYAAKREYVSVRSLEQMGFMWGWWTPFMLEAPAREMFPIRSDREIRWAVRQGRGVGCFSLCSRAQELAMDAGRFLSVTRSVDGPETTLTFRFERRTIAVTATPSTGEYLIQTRDDRDGRLTSIQAHMVTPEVAPQMPSAAETATRKQFWYADSVASAANALNWTLGRPSDEPLSVADLNSMAGQTKATGFYSYTFPQTPRDDGAWVIQVTGGSTTLALAYWPETSEIHAAEHAPHKGITASSKATRKPINMKGTK